MAQKKAAKSVEEQVQETALAVESGEKIELDLPSGKNLVVNNLTGFSTIRIARIVGKDILTIMGKIPGKATMEEIAFVVMEEVHEDRVAEMVKVILGSDELLHCQWDDIMAGVEQYVEKVGAKQVFTMISKGRDMVQKGLQDQAQPFGTEVAKNVKK